MGRRFPKSRDVGKPRTIDGEIEVPAAVVGAIPVFFKIGGLRRKCPCQITHWRIGAVSGYEDRAIVPVVVVGVGRIGGLLAIHKSYAVG